MCGLCRCPSVLSNVLHCITNIIASLYYSVMTTMTDCSGSVEHYRSADDIQACWNMIATAVLVLASS